MDVQDVLAQTTRGEKSAYLKCWIVKFVLVTRTTREYPPLVTGVCLGGDGHVGLHERTGFIIRIFVASSGTLRGYAKLIQMNSNVSRYAHLQGFGCPGRPG